MQLGAVPGGGEPDRPIVRVRSGTCQLPNSEVLEAGVIGGMGSQIRLEGEVGV
jgi:hypothetical protein